MSMRAAVRAPKGPTTKALLIGVGERLFGERGLDGVSLREIAAEARQSNSNVVQYHFGEKAGLVRAILEDRGARIEELRASELAGRDMAQPSEPRDILKLLWLPMMAFRAEDGSHPFCRFMLQYMLHPKVTCHPLAPVYNFPFGPDDAESAQPAGKRAALLLFGAFGHVPRTLVFRRISVLATMFLASVVEHDNARVGGAGGARADYDINPILDMAVAALGAPSGY